MHTKPDLRVLLKWMIHRSGSVIVAVMPLKTGLCNLPNEMLERSTSTWPALL